jgi:nucleotide-binding universal stress UspA family protein
MLPIRTILLPTDLSDWSENAFQAACGLARGFGARVMVLYVKAPPVVAYGELGPVVPDPIQTTDDLIDRLGEMHHVDPRLRVEYRVADGDPASEIVRLAKELPADLVVMATHGRTGLRRLLMGSVAEAVVRRASCPVLTLKTPFPAAVETPAPADREPVMV